MVAVGTVYCLQNPRWLGDCIPGPSVGKVPWQVEAFINGLLHAVRRDPETGRWGDSYWSGRSDMAVVCSLRDGRWRTVAMRLLVRRYPNPGIARLAARERSGLSCNTLVSQLGGQEWAQAPYQAVPRRKATGEKRKKEQSK